MTTSLARRSYAALPEKVGAAGRSSLLAKGKEEAGYGGKVYLYDTLRFQCAFPIFDSSQKLTLSHYRILSWLENPKEGRLLYCKQELLDRGLVRRV